MHGADFLQDLAAVMIVAGVVTILFHRFKQPVVLGYILAGVIIGPHTPPFPFIHNEATINTLAELGVILLMFALGLEFSLRKLKQVGVPAFIAAFLEILLMVWVGYEMGLLFGWKAMDNLFLGAMLSISSTTIIIKALSSLGKTKQRFAQLIFGILIIEDVLGIAMIALLSSIAMTGAFRLADVGVTLGKLGVFLVASLVVGLMTVPRLLAYVARFKSNEMLLVTVLGLCFGFSLLALKLGYSVALGAFLIGAVIAEAREIHRVEALIEPVRDMFSAIFFVAIGLLLDPKILIQYWLPILAISAAVVVGKVITCSLGAFVGGNDTRTSLRVGMGLAQIGEFSFIIASLGLTLNVTSKFLYPIAVAVSVLTTLLTPYLVKNSDRVVQWLDRLAPRPLARTLQLYTQWVGKLGHQRHTTLATRLIKRWGAQMALNAVLMAGIFLAAIFVGEHPPELLRRVGAEEEHLKMVLWLAAALLSLPLFIATSRKLQALGLLLAETRVTSAEAGIKTAAIRAIVAQVVPLVGTSALGFYVLVLSSALLPPFNLFIGLVALVVLIAWLLRRSLIKVYSKGQIALQEALATPPVSQKTETAGKLPSMLREADLETVILAPHSRAARKLIRELALRTDTGASIIGLERNGMSIINPGPDEELQAGDHVLLLGNRTQLDQAKEALR